MSTSILYHGFGISFYCYTKTEYQQGALIFSIEKEPTSLRCGIVSQITLGFADADARLPEHFNAMSLNRQKGYDRSQCCPTPGNRLAHRQGNSEDASLAPICPTRFGTSGVVHYQQGTLVSHRGVRPSFRRCCLCR